MTNLNDVDIWMSAASHTCGNLYKNWGHFLQRLVISASLWSKIPSRLLLPFVCLISISSPSMIWQALCRGQSWDQCYLQSISKEYQRLVVYEGKSLLIPDCDLASLKIFNSHHNILLSKSMKLKSLLISDCDGVGLEGDMDTSRCGARKSFSTSTILLGRITMRIIVIMVNKMMTMMTITEAKKMKMFEKIMRYMHSALVPAQAVPPPK